MQAMVLAAGLGSRLAPLTHHIPKPLFPVFNRPNIERIVMGLAREGFNNIYINVFHLAENILSWASGLDLNGSRIHILRESMLLGTGGALANAYYYLDRHDPILVINSDIVTDISLRRTYEIHKRHGCLASLVIHRRTPWNKIKVLDGAVVEFDYTGHDAHAFTGISVLDPEFISRVPRSKGSLIDVLERVIHAGERVLGIDIDIISHDPLRHLWEDIGSPEGYLGAHEALIKRGWSGNETLISASVVPDDASFHDWVVIGSGVSMGSSVTVKRSVIWDNVRIPRGSVVEDCICTPFGILGRDGGWWGNHEHP